MFINTRASGPFSRLQSLSKPLRNSDQSRPFTVSCIVGTIFQHQPSSLGNISDMDVARRKLVACTRIKFPHLHMLDSNFVCAASSRLFGNEVRYLISMEGASIRFCLYNFWLRFATAHIYTESKYLTALFLFASRLGCLPNPIRYLSPRSR